MWAAAAMAVAVIHGAASDRVLVCRPRIGGDAALARGEALGEAVRSLGDRVLDYGIPCETPGEAARAARRAGLGHAVVVAAEGHTEGSRFDLIVVDAEERTLAVRRIEVEPGAEAAPALSSHLGGLLAELPQPARARARRRAAWGLAGGGVALLGAGVALAAVARSDAGRANGAGSPGDYLEARQAWERSRGLSGAALGLGAAALIGGLTWRFQLGGEE
jgi:hypothetical protein